MTSVRFCNLCGHEVVFRVPHGDHLPRHECPHCGHIQYFNPRVIVGCIPEALDGRVLMCKRAIEPRLDKWTFPAGFMELSESCAAGAAREVLEESQADVEVEGLVTLIDVVYISQVYMIYRGRMRSDHFGPTHESSEVCLMHESEIPWDEIAFPTVWHGLRLFFADRSAGQFRPHFLTLKEHSSGRRFDEVSEGDPPPPENLPSGD